MDTKPLLSICIPTYNRAELLTNSLESIVHQDRFDEIEVIISDNCSTDDTAKVGKKYSSSYKNIKYFRNDVGMATRENAIESLLRANGILRKLSNDTIIYKNGSITYLLEVINRHINDRPLMYFIDTDSFNNDQQINDRKVDKELMLDNFDSYVKCLGYRLTWYANLTVWEEDCEDFSIWKDDGWSSLGQVPYQFFIFERHHRAVVLQKLFQGAQAVKRKELSYGLYKVFYTNFLSFFTNYLEMGILSWEAYQHVRKELLFDFFLDWIVEIIFNKKNYLTAEENLKKLIDKEYRGEEYYKDYKSTLRKKILLRARGNLLFPVRKAINIMKNRSIGGRS